MLTLILYFVLFVIMIPIMCAIFEFMYGDPEFLVKESKARLELNRKVMAALQERVDARSKSKF